MAAYRAAMDPEPIKIRRGAKPGNPKPKPPKTSWPDSLDDLP